MGVEGGLRDLSARCLALVNGYDLGAGTDEAGAEMAVKVRELVRQVPALLPAEGEVDEEVLRPVGAHLRARHGHEAGARLFDEFLRAFEAAGRDFLGGPVGEAPAPASSAIAPRDGRLEDRAGEAVR